MDFDTALRVVKHLISPTIPLLHDVTRSSPDDEFQEFSTPAFSAPPYRRHTRCAAAIMCGRCRLLVSVIKKNDDTYSFRRVGLARCAGEELREPTTVPSVRTSHPTSKYFHPFLSAPSSDESA